MASSQMSDNHLLLWNARGLNSRARRNVLRNIVELQRASIVCVQETKLSNISASINTELTGSCYDFGFLPASGVAGDASISWRVDQWDVSASVRRRYSITIEIRSLASQQPWWLSNVYGPSSNSTPEKTAFLQELRDIRAACARPWIVCGDFNMIYQAADKNHGRLHRGHMRAFRDTIDVLQLQELHLSGRLYTWSNGRDSPTLERIDRAFASVEWLQLYPFHHLRSLASDCSDHSPLLLVLKLPPLGGSTVPL